MNADPPQGRTIGVEIEGPGPVYFDQVVVDNLIDALMEIAGELWAVRDRQYILERVLGERGIEAAALIEAYRPDAQEIAARKQMREAFVGRVFGGFLRRPE